MSITKDFETMAWVGGEFNHTKVTELLAHTRALEAMLKKHEWSGFRDYGENVCCPECRNYAEDHADDC